MPLENSEMKTARYTSNISVPVDALYRYHASGGALQRLLPPWQDIRLQSWKGGNRSQHKAKWEQFGDISVGSEVTLSIHKGPFAVTMRAKHVEESNPHGFVDEQVQGMFQQWKHQHQFLPLSTQHSQLTDSISYHPKMSLLTSWFVEREIDKMFTFRHKRTQYDVEYFAQFANLPKYTIAISGSTGFVGRNLLAYLRAAGHDVRTIVRTKTDNPHDILWDISKKWMEKEKLEGVDVVIHLAGESIDQRWTASAKQRILQSRKEGTELLASTIVELQRPPKVCIFASAIGVYGSNPEYVCDEDAPMGTDFLSTVCQVWESAAQPLKEVGIRVVQPRLGVVIGAQGGVLQKMLLPFSLGLGGNIGSGRQWMSWVALDDVLRSMLYMIHTDHVQGPINLVSPQPLQNADFTKILGTVLHRPTWFSVPSPAIRLLFGEMGEALVLQGARVNSNRLQQMGFSFQWSELSDFLRFELGM
jgi:uncharacterized protein (TIGR01777 family)